MKFSKVFAAVLIVGTGVFASSAAFSMEDKKTPPAVDPCACKATASSYVQIGGDISTSSAVGRSVATFASLGDLDGGKKHGSLTIGLTGASATVGDRAVKTGNVGLDTTSEVY
jgi:hypothetical protein